MRITAYGHRLIEDLNAIDWPEKVKLMQRNWIGESHGASVDFTVATPQGERMMEIYTTRPDTLFGTTFCVVSPEHPLLADVPEQWPGERTMEIYTTRPDTLFGTTFCVVSPEHPLLADVPEQWPDGTPEAWTGGYGAPREAVADYRAAAAAKTAKDRVDDAGEKTGLFTGLYATNPITGVQLPTTVRPRPPRRRRTVWTTPVRRRACSPACMPPIRSRACSCRCSPRTMC